MNSTAVRRKEAAAQVAKEEGLPPLEMPREQSVVYDRARAQYIAAGEPSERADLQAKIDDAVYQAMAKHTGRIVEQVMERRPISVTKGKPEAGALDQMKKNTLGLHPRPSTRREAVAGG